MGPEPLSSCAAAVASVDIFGRGKYAGLIADYNDDSSASSSSSVKRGAHVQGRPAISNVETRFFGGGHKGGLWRTGM